MATRVPAPRLVLSPSRAVLLGLLVVGAAAVGGLTTVEPVYAGALVIAAAICVIVAWDVNALPLFLVFTMFVESLSLGPGLRIGRIAGGMALFVLAYYLLAHGRARVRPNALLFAAGAYGFWTLFSVYWASDSGLVYTTTFSYLLAVAYMLTFATLVRSTRQLVAIFATLAVGSLAFGLVSFATYAGSSGGSRAAGLVGDPNYFAVYQVVALPAALALAAGERRAQRRLMYYAVVGAIVLSVVSSLSRTGLLALSGVLLATLLVPWRAFFRSAGQRLTYVLVLLIAAGVAALAGSAPFVERVQTIMKPNGDRGSGRLDLWSAGWHGFRDHPWGGIGAGNFQAKALDLLQTTPGVDTTRNYITRDNVVHNSYLETLTELGVVGFVFFALIIVLTARYYIVAFRRARAAGDTALERFSLALLVSLFGFLVSGFFLSNELGRPLWILVGLALALDVMSKRAAPAEAPAPPVRVVPALERVLEPEEGAEYDLGVREQLVEQRERRVVEQMEALFADQERLERRRVALTERELELRGKARELEVAERQLEQLDQRAEALASRERDLDDREAVIVPQEQALLARARAVEGVEEQAAELALQMEALRERESALEARMGELEIAQRQAVEIAERAQALAEREQEFARRDEELATREEEFSSRWAELERLEQTATARGREVAEREQATAEELEAVAARERDLDARVGELEARQQALAARAAELERAETERSAAAAALAERERELEQAETALGGRERQLAAKASEVEEIERARAEREAQVAEREAALELRARTVTEGEQRYAALAADLDRREQEIVQWEAERAAIERGLLPIPEYPPAAEVPVPPPAPPPAVERLPEPPRAPEPVPAPEPAPAPPEPVAAAAGEPGEWNLNELESLVEAQAAARPDRIDEWRYYLLYLRDFADPTGALPASFDWLVWDTFGELLGQR